MRRILLRYGNAPVDTVFPASRSGDLQNIEKKIWTTLFKEGQRVLYRREKRIFEFKEDLRSELFIRVPRFYIEKKFWANLPSSSKAIYPIIFKHSNADGVSFPSQLTIAILAGVTEKTVRDGLAGLEGFPEYKRTRYYTNRGHIAYKYAITPSSKNRRLFSVSHAFFNGGNWSLLTPTAKSIYFTLKHYSWWDWLIYSELDEGANLFIPENPYIYREFDFLDADCEIIAEMSGITKKSLREAYQSLIKNYFIEYIGKVDGRDTWKLFVQPSTTYKPNWLNDKLKKRYAVSENITY